MWYILNYLFHTEPNTFLKLFLKNRKKNFINLVGKKRHLLQKKSSTRVILKCFRKFSNKLKLLKISNPIFNRETLLLKPRIVSTVMKFCKCINSFQTLRRNSSKERFLCLKINLQEILICPLKNFLIENKPYFRYFNSAVAHPTQKRIIIHRNEFFEM